MKQQLTKEQSRKLMELGVPTEKASSSIVEETQGNGCSWTYPVFTIGDLLQLTPPLRGKFTIMRDNGKWKVGSLYSQSISFSETNAVWKMKIEKEELIDALFEFVVRFIKAEKK